MPGLSAGAIKIISALIVGTGVAAGGGYLIKDKDGKPIIQSLLSTPEPDKTVGVPDQAEPATGQEQIASLPESPQPDASGEPGLPVFDLLRVEPDGSVVVAGNAPPLSTVEIIAGGKVMGRGDAGPNGDFAIVFDDPLPPGDHELYIRASFAGGGEPVVSDEAGIVSIPDGGGEALAMVTAQGAPSRVMQKPEEPAIAETQSEPASEEPAAEVVAAEISPVQVEAVDVEDGRVFVAGRGEAGRRVAVYINDSFRGSTTIGPEGAFLLDISGGLEAGSHDFRVDMLEAQGGEVESRVSVMVEHADPEPSVEVASAPEPAVEPEPAEPEPAEPVASSEPAEQPAAETQQPELAAQPAAEPQQPAAEAVAEAPPQAKPVIRTGTAVIIRRGDNLWKVSRRLLGEGRKYTVIFSANANQIQNPDLIFPGQVLDIPEEGDTAAGSGSGSG